MTGTRRPSSVRPTPPRRRGRAVIVAGVAAAVALVAVAWATQRDGDHDDHVASRDDPGVTHVHGLGVDPADGTLYAATHHGVFRIPEEGEATRVANRFQDTMGFTVAGPNRFLASGHPDFRDKELFQEGRDPHLGLIESTDAGQTWTALSLLGEADFHALAAAHGRIYGYSATSGEFMVSPDGKTWDRRSSTALISFGVDPDDPEHVVATTTQAGLAASKDGGRSWQPISGGPPLTFLTWDTDAGLWGAGPDGTIHRSVDEGATWTRQATLSGKPEALLAEGSVLYAAVSEEGILRSGDGGRTWQVRYRDRS